MKKNITFCYDAMQDNWVECTLPEVPEWQTANAENLPVLFVTKIHDERSGEESVQVWCETHRAYEKVDRCTYDGLATEQGCSLKGMSVYADTFVDPFRYIYTELTNETTLRWQVRHCPEKGTVEISQDNILFSFDWIRKENGDFVLVPFLHSIRHMKIKLSLRDNIPRRCLFPMPVTVAAAALAALHEEAVKLYGFAPPVLLPMRSEAMGIGYLGGGKHGGGKTLPRGSWPSCIVHSTCESGFSETISTRRNSRSCSHGRRRTISPFSAEFLASRQTTRRKQTTKTGAWIS